MNSVIKFFKGFYFAAIGIITGFKERNMRFHGIATILVLFASFYYKLSVSEFTIILVLIALVLSAELFNSSIEELADLLRDSNKLNYRATRAARDMAAGAVLVIAIVAAIIGGIIFIPKIW